MTQTLTQAVHCPRILRALGQLSGCPEGGWGETTQALVEVEAACPHRDYRDYEVADLIRATTIVDDHGYYRMRRETRYAVADNSGRYWVVADTLEAARAEAIRQHCPPRWTQAEREEWADRCVAPAPVRVYTTTVGDVEVAR